MTLSAAKTEDMIEQENRVNHPPPTSTKVNQPPPRSTTERNHLINSMLTKERPKIYQLKCGIHNKKFYYGTILYQKRKPRTVVITSDRECYVDWGFIGRQREPNEIKEDYGLYYREDFEHDALDSHWSVEGIRKFLENKHEKKTITNIYQEVLKNNKEYMYYPDDITHEIVALDIISTYFMPCFSAKGRVFLEAEPGSGKTRQCTLYKFQAFNSIMSADITKASFFRIMEGTCGTLIVDDFDSISDEQKTDVKQHYKTGYKNTSKSVRTGEGVGKKKKQETFRNYGHCVMNNTTGLDPISAERTIFLPIVKSERSVVNKDLLERDSRWKEITDALFTMGLLYWKEVRDVYEQLESKLKGRELEISKPLLTIAQLISPELKERVENHLYHVLTRSKLVDIETDWGYLAFQEVKDMRDGEKKPLTVIRDSIANKLYDPNDFGFQKQAHGISTFLGKQFRKFDGIFKITPINGKNTLTLLSRRKLDEYMKVKRWSLVDPGVPNNPSQQNIIVDSCVVKEAHPTVQDVSAKLKENGESDISKLYETYGEPLTNEALNYHKERGDVLELRPGVVRWLE